jgi:hypothetical protein
MQTNGKVYLSSYAVGKKFPPKKTASLIINKNMLYNLVVL